MVRPRAYRCVSSALSYRSPDPLSIQICRPVTKSYVIRHSTSSLLLTTTASSAYTIKTVSDKPLSVSRPCCPADLLSTFTARLTSTIVAHTDAINAIDIDPNSSSTLVSGGDDCSCKIWDITTGTCSQDWTHHRLRTDQGVLAVKFCDKVPVLTTGGADGVLRVYVKST
jgi:WD40 repeat protein